MKKVLALVLVAILSLTMFTACSTGAETVDPATEAPVSESAPAEESADSEQTEVRSCKFAYASADLSVEYFANQVNQIIDYCASVGCELVSTVDAGMDMQKQLDQIQQIVASGNVDAIICQPVDTAIGTELASAAGDIPMVFLNRTPDPAIIEGKQFTYVGSSETDAGKMEGDMCVEWIKAHNIDTINYVILLGQSGAENAEQRRSSAIEALEASGLPCNEVATVDCSWIRATAMEQMETIMTTGKEFNVIIGGNDECALGAVEAMTVNGMDPTSVCIVGIDAIADGLQAVSEGTMYGTLFQDSVGQVKMSIDLALKMLNGETCEVTNLIPFEAITAENVADYM